jgi:tight adherence protein B
MGALLGLVLAAGVLLVVASVAGRRSIGRAVAATPGSDLSDLSGLSGLSGLSDRPSAVEPARPWAAARQRLTDTLVAADLHGVRPGAIVAISAVAGILVLTLTAGISHTYPVAVVFGGFAAWAPFALIRRRAAARREELRGLWPDAVDNLASSVRAGLSLPEALIQLSVRGPEPLRGAFARFGADYRATGRFSDCLDALKDNLADPVADRIVEALRLARDVGGSDLGRLLRTLSAFLREDAHTRGELVSRQSWTVNAARLGVAAPWIVLALLSLQTDVVEQYNSRAGVVVLAIGLATSVLAYRLMSALGRLPEDIRVLR